MQQPTLHLIPTTPQTPPLLLLHLTTRRPSSEQQHGDHNNDADESLDTLINRESREEGGYMVEQDEFVVCVFLGKDLKTCSLPRPEFDVGMIQERDSVCLWCVMCVCVCV